MSLPVSKKFTLQIVPCPSEINRYEYPFFAVSLFFGEPVSRLLTKSGSYEYITRLLFVILIFDTVVIYPTLVLRAENRLKYYSFVAFARFSLFIGENKERREALVVDKKSGFFVYEGIVYADRALDRAVAVDKRHSAQHIYQQPFPESIPHLVQPKAEKLIVVVPVVRYIR